MGATSASCPLSNTMTRDTTTCSSTEVHVHSHREPRRAQRAGRCPASPRVSPCVSTGLKEELRSEARHPASPPLLSCFPRSAHSRPRVSSAWPRLLPPEGSSVVRSENGLQSRGPLRPPLAHAHTPPLAQVAAPEGPCCSRRGTGRPGCLAYSAPPTGLPGKRS